MEVKKRVKEDALRLAADMEHTSKTDSQSIAQSIGNANNVMARLSKFISTEEQMEEFVNRSFLSDGMVKEKCHVVFYGPSGTGKTTLSFFLCKEMLKTNTSLVIFYFLLDGAEDIALNASRWINDHRLNIATTANAKEVVFELNTMLNRKDDLTNILLIFDTYKKFQTDVNNKSGNAKHMEFIRQLTKRGATCISIAHTNKNGEQMSGTAELEQDSDAVFRFDSVDDVETEGNMLVSIKDSGRCRWKPTKRSFNMPKYNPDPSLVKDIDFIDIEKWKEEDKDSHTISAIKNFIKDNNGTASNKELLKVIPELTGDGRPTIASILNTYNNRHWFRWVDKSRGKAYEYSLTKKDSACSI